MSKMCRKFFPAVVVGLLLSGCAWSAGTGTTVETHLARADALVEQRDYLGAAEAVGRASRQRPGVPSLVLRQGELLEAAGRPEAARKAYLRGMAEESADLVEKQELHYRLLLLLTLKLADAAGARPLLVQLPADSPRHLDAQGVLAYADGRYQEALLLFEQARETTAEQDLRARALYHTALAYARAGDPDLARLALFHAVNQAQSLGVRKDIELFFSRLQAPNP
jgi:tetratricopeptide (TPR) repeat protein